MKPKSKSKSNSKSNSKSTPKSKRNLNPDPPVPSLPASPSGDHMLIPASALPCLQMLTTIHISLLLKSRLPDGTEMEEPQYESTSGSIQSAYSQFWSSLIKEIGSYLSRHNPMIAACESSLLIEILSPLDPRYHNAIKIPVNPGVTTSGSQEPPLSPDSPSGETIQ